MTIDTLRFKEIRKMVEGKSVLDIGCVDHYELRANMPEWLHGYIAKFADKLVGLDTAEEAAKLLRQRGYDIRIGDAEKVDLGERFDVVVAGEIIEHMENPGLLLRTMLRHLKPGGEIIMSTPNPFYPLRQLEILFKGRCNVHPEHTMWFCPQTLGYIVSRAGFIDIKVTPFSNSESFFRLGRLPGWIRPWFATQLLVTARRTNS